MTHREVAPISPAALSGTDLYQRLHTGNDHDLAFYRKVIDGARSVLELGCGWGRITNRLASDIAEPSQPLELVGVDIEPVFVERAKNEAAHMSGATQPDIEFLVQDIRQLQLLDTSGKPRVFDRILLPYNTIFALGGASGLRECLSAALRHLAPEGELWFDFYAMDDFHESALEEEPPPDDDEPILEFRYDDQDVVVVERTDVDTSAQRLDVRYVARSESTGSQLGELAMTHHYLLIEQIENIAEECGYDVLTTVAGFSGASSTSQSDSSVQEPGDGIENRDDAGTARQAADESNELNEDEADNQIIFALERKSGF